MLVTPEMDEATDGTASLTQLFDDLFRFHFVQIEGRLLGAFDEPFNQHARFGISQTTNDPLIAKNSIQQRPG